MKRKSKALISVLQRKLWEECKRLTREKYGYNCYTCGKTNLTPNDCHTGHFLPKASVGAYLKYDLRILRPQCYNCNINLGGNGALFYRKLVEQEGKKYVEQIFKDKNNIVNAFDHYTMLLEKYRGI